jgi:polysaccharide deacetylase 2 family uncharacterized protein YibQ
VLAAVAGVALVRWGTGTPPAPVRPAATPAVVASARPLPSPAPVVAATTAPPRAPSLAPSLAPAGSAADGRPRLAIIIDDCGQWPQTEREFVALPFPLTLAVLPHVRYGSAIAQSAVAAGKGVMLHLPMETISGRYPGPGEITTTMDDDAIRTQLRADLADVPLARGVNNHEGSRATADTRVMTDIIAVLAGTGRFFIDSRTTKDTVAESTAREHGVPTARRNVFLDDVDDVVAVEAALRRAAAVAREQGSAIAIGHPRAATLAAVRALGPELQAGGIAFVLVSELAR